MRTSECHTGGVLLDPSEKRDFVSCEFTKVLECKTGMSFVTRLTPVGKI